MNRLDLWLSVSTIRNAELRRNGRVTSCALTDEHGLRFSVRSLDGYEDAIAHALAKYETDMAEARAETERDDERFIRETADAR